LSHTRNYNSNNKTLKSGDSDEIDDDSIAELFATDKESKLMFKKMINENISSIDVHENETINAVEDDEYDLFVSDLNQAAYDEEQIESEDVILDVDSVIDEMNDLAVADSFEEEAVDDEFVKKQMIDKLNALSKLGGIDTWSIASTNQSDFNFVFVNFLIFVLNLILL
jgi:hypothetical protein